MALILGAVVLAGGIAAPREAGAGNIDASALPRPDLLESALAAYRRVEAAGLLRTRILTVIDYSLPSSQRRLWVLEPAELRVLFHEFVAHGRGSTSDTNPDLAVNFGNEISSLRTSLGTFLTGTTYIGKYGRSLEIVGLDPGVNDKALERRIVIHPAKYVGAEFRAKWGGRVGRSFGCPALDPDVAAAIIDRIQESSVIYAGGPSVQPLASLATAGLGEGASQAR